MELAQFLKYAGIAVAAVSSLVALFGETRQEGRFTFVGKVSLVFIVIGFLTSIAGEYYQRRESETTERIAQGWESLKNENVEFVGAEFYVSGQAKIGDFVGFTNLTKITLQDTRSNSRESVSLKFQVEKPKRNGVNDLVKLATYPVNSRVTTSREETELFTLEVRRGELRGVFDPKKKLTDRNSKICGIASKISWKDIGFKNIKSLKDLVYLNITLEGPENYNFPVELLGPSDPKALFVITIETPSFTFELPLESANFNGVTDEHGMKSMTKTINGVDLLYLFKNKFFESGKTRGDSLTDNRELHSITGRINTLRHVMHFGNP